nr:radical SAM protein [Actinomycetota bacterium]
EVRPSFLPFTPWTTLDGVRDLLDFVADHDLVGNVDPVQYTIRLLLPKGSLLLDHPDLAPVLGPYDAERLSYTWISTEPSIDALHLQLAALVEERVAAGASIADTYLAVRAAVGAPELILAASFEGRPRLTEPWFCCAEPTEGQFSPLRGS